MPKKKKQFKFFWEEPIEPVKKAVSEPLEFRFTFPRVTAPKPGFPGIEKNIPVSINETDRGILIRAELPGFKKNEINLIVTENTIDIYASKKEERLERTERVFRHEKTAEGLRRAFTLPEKVDPDKSKAKFEDGLLTIILPKISQEKKKKKKLEIK